MIRALSWLFHPLPNTDDPETRKAVVWSMLALQFVLLVGLIVSVNLVLADREKLDGRIRFERHLCESQNHGRRQAVARNDVIRGYLRTIGAAGIAAKVKDSPLLDCGKGTELQTPSKGGTK